MYNNLSQIVICLYKNVLNNNLIQINLKFKSEKLLKIKIYSNLIILKNFQIEIKLIMNQLKKYNKMIYTIYLIEAIVSLNPDNPLLIHNKILIINILVFKWIKDKKILIMIQFQIVVMIILIHYLQKQTLKIMNNLKIDNNI